jgi:hypothetical protein
MEYKNKIIPTKILLSLDGSESFIIRQLKDQIMSDPIQFGCASFSDSGGKKYRLVYDNEINKTDVLKSIEFIYYRDEHSPEFFELNNFNTDRIKIKDPVVVSYKLVLFGDKGVVYLHKIVEFFILVNDVYTIKIIGVICIGKHETNVDISNLFNKITSVILADRYAFIGHKFKINNYHISMKIDYAPGYDIDKGSTELVGLLEDALEKYYAPLRKLEK